MISGFIVSIWKVCGSLNSRVSTENLWIYRVWFIVLSTAVMHSFLLLTSSYLPSYYCSYSRSTFLFVWTNIDCLHDSIYCVTTCMHIAVYLVKCVLWNRSIHHSNSFGISTRSTQSQSAWMLFAISLLVRSANAFLIFHTNTSQMYIFITVLYNKYNFVHTTLEEIKYQQLQPSIEWLHRFFLGTKYL